MTRDSARLLELRDVHAPARFREGEMHWQMASGPDAVDVRVTTAALDALGKTPRTSYRDLFEQNREFLCALAAIKAPNTPPGEPIRIDRKDIPSRSR